MTDLWHFTYFRFGRTLILVSYQGNKENNIEDFQGLPVSLRSFLIQQKTCTLNKMADKIKKQLIKTLLGQIGGGLGSFLGYKLGFKSKPFILNEQNKTDALVQRTIIDDNDDDEDFTEPADVNFGGSNAQQPQQEQLKLLFGHKAMKASNQKKATSNLSIPVHAETRPASPSPSSSNNTLAGTSSPAAGTSSSSTSTAAPAPPPRPPKPSLKSFQAIGMNPQ